MDNTQNKTDVRAPGESATTLERVQYILKEDLGYRDECLSPDARFAEDIGMDSLDMVEMVLEVEEEFSVTLEDEDAEKIDTIGQLVEWLDAHKN